MPNYIRASLIMRSPIKNRQLKMAMSFLNWEYYLPRVILRRILKRVNHARSRIDTN
jgi:hypothetical protein